VVIYHKNNLLELDHHPVCAAKVASRLSLNRASTHPRRGGEFSRSFRKFHSVPLLLAFLLLSGCGYHLANPNFKGGAGQTMAVPAFANRTTTYRIDQRLTEAVRQEFIRRTHYQVVPAVSGDVVMSGEVLNYTAVPVLFDQQGRGSAYEILIDMKVLVTETKTGKVLFQNDRFTFREVFELSQTSADFIPEDPAAMDRLARSFASFLVSSIMHVKPS
jgi:outer membrane lipopolysaccharide assembly protein LptE/RlpB